MGLLTSSLMHTSPGRADPHEQRAESSFTSELIPSTSDNPPERHSADARTLRMCQVTISRAHRKVDCALWDGRLALPTGRGCTATGASAVSPGADIQYYISSVRVADHDAAAVKYHISCVIVFCSLTDG